MSESTEKLESRIMGDYSIAKSFKGILRIAHILELVKTEEDQYFNPTYYGSPSTLMNISGNAYESAEMGFNTPIDGMNGSITRYSQSNEKIANDNLRINRVPMTDSMGNYMNWNIGLDGVTIGSDENINGNYIDLDWFVQDDYTPSAPNQPIWQKKFFPVVEAGHIKIGLDNKVLESEKYKINGDSGVFIENTTKGGQLIIENKYDKTIDRKYEHNDVTEGITRRFIQYKPNSNFKYRTIYSDNKSNPEEYDVFMYRQDDWDCHNYNYKISDLDADDKNYRGNAEVLENFHTTNSSDGTYKIGDQISKTIDAHVGIVNLKEYVTETINKYMQNSMIEVPTGTIINQFCSLEKWFASPDSGSGNDQFTGHRPAMMNKRDVGMIPNSAGDGVMGNPFVQSTVMGACRKINKLINTNYNKENHETNSNQQTDEQVEKDDGNLNYSLEGYHKEIIPLYKRDYVLCDGSLYSIFLFPKNYTSRQYPNRRDTMDRFLDLFFTIGYEYTTKDTYINKRFSYTWDTNTNTYKILNEKNDIINYENCLIISGSGEGIPKFSTIYPKFNEDRHAVFVEDFLTMLAFEEIYKKYSQGYSEGFTWDYESVCDWLKTVEIPEKYRLQTFLGDSNKSITKEKYNNKCSVNYFTIARDGNFVMDLPYYNFNNDGKYSQNTNRPLPIINLGREVKTFNDPVKFYDTEAQKWTIVEAWKLPQIQYLIDIMVCNSIESTLAPILNSHFKYDFQVPNLTNTSPSFIGSSGIMWCDSKFRRVREVESWSCSYSQKNFMHRHLLFVEPKQINPSICHEYLNRGRNRVQKGNNWVDGNNTTGYNGGNPPPAYKLSGTAGSNSYIASAACRSGKINCQCGGSYNFSYNFGEGDNPNYIWNELGCGDKKKSNVTIKNESITTNGMRYPILQAAAPTYFSWNTGKNRTMSAVDAGGDFQQVAGNAELIKEIWNESGDLGSNFINKKYEYEKNHWYGWEHYEDPRFDSSEPNRGRTSEPVNVKELDTVSKKRYEINGKNFTINQDKGEWFSPENIKMLPLIKL